MQKVVKKVALLSWSAMILQLLAGATSIIGAVIASSATTKDVEKLGLFACGAIVVIALFWSLIRVGTKVIGVIGSLADLAYKKRNPAIDEGVEVLGRTMLVSSITPILVTLVTWSGLVAEVPMQGKVCFVLTLVLSIVAAVLLMVVKEEIDSNRSTLTSLHGVSVSEAPDPDMSRFDKKRAAPDADVDADELGGRKARIEL